MCNLEVAGTDFKTCLLYYWKTGKFSSHKWRLGKAQGIISTDTAWLGLGLTNIRSKALGTQRTRFPKPGPDAEIKDLAF